MIGVVVVTHSQLAWELVQSAEMIIGPVQGVCTVSIDRGMSVDAAKQALQQALDEVGKDGDGVLILTDMFGGTPTNLSAEFLCEDRVEILTGVNLPMLIKGLNSRGGQTVSGLAGMLKEYARNAVLRPSELLAAAKLKQ